MDSSHGSHQPFLRHEDEIQVKFSPGLHLPGLGRCDPQPSSENLDTPGLKTFSSRSETNDGMTLIGPCVGATESNVATVPGSGPGEPLVEIYKYGPNPRLPGLVVLADAGPGVVTDDRFNLVSPREGRNLAGFFQSVAYELKDSRDRTSLLVHMNVPKNQRGSEGLFSPVVLADETVGDRCGERADGTPPPSLARVDGGPKECLSELSRPVVTIRAFVVNGEAPGRLADVNGDDVVDIADAEQGAWRILSGEAILRIRQAEELIPTLFYDFNGDGEASIPKEMPSDPLSLEDPPR